MANLNQSRVEELGWGWGAQPRGRAARELAEKSQPSEVRRGTGEHRGLSWGFETVGAALGLKTTPAEGPVAWGSGDGECYCHPRARWAGVSGAAVVGECHGPSADIWWRLAKPPACKQPHSGL